MKFEIILVIGPKTAELQSARTILNSLDKSHLYHSRGNLTQYEVRLVEATAQYL